MLSEITLTNFLSYGPGGLTLELHPLNVLIGPNGSGKSNLVEAFSVLREVRGDLSRPIRRGGRIEDWLWRSDDGSALEYARIEVLFRSGAVPSRPPLSPVSYSLEFGGAGGQFVVTDERVANGVSVAQALRYFSFQTGRAELMMADGQRRVLEPADIDRTQSILSQRRDPESYPEVTAVGDRLGEILIYRSWSFGPEARIRQSCGADVRSDRLLEDFSNLPARLMSLKRDPSTKRRLLELLPEVAPGFSDLEVIVEGGRLQLYLTEGRHTVSALRLSDGTLRYLALVAILLDPGPTGLVVIEEPELGLHPDLLPLLRDLLVEASARFQLIVTTHSTQLVDAMTDYAGSVIVCDKDEQTSVLSRLQPDDVARWREFGTLGSQWMSGRLGGTRW